MPSPKTNHAFAHFDTRTTLPKDRFSLWNRFFSNHITQVEMSCASPSSFNGNLSLHYFSNGMLAFGRADEYSEQNVVQAARPSLEAANKPRWLVVYHRLAGTIRQNHSICAFRPNDVILVDTQKSYQREANAVYFTMVLIPQHSVHGVLNQQELELAALRGISATQGVWPRLLSMFLKTLTPAIAAQLAIREIDASLLYDHFLHLLIGALRETRNHEVKRSDDQTSLHNLSHRRLFHCIQQWLQQNHSRSNVTAQSVASEFDISTRYVHRLFAQHLDKFSFHSYLQTYRLDQAMYLLRDPAMHSQTIADISDQCGFSSPAYFCFVFRKHVGCPPSEYRARLLPPGQPASER